MPVNKSNEKPATFPTCPPLQSFTAGANTDIGKGSLEVVLPSTDASIRWTQHGYPSRLARWHHHPEIEIHLIREGHGYMMAGDDMVPFDPGQVSLIGSNLPHNWISDLLPGEKLEHRDVVCQVRPERLKALIASFPEAARIRKILSLSNRAIVLTGNSASRIADTLLSMGEHSDVERLADLMTMLVVFASAPETELYSVVTQGYTLALADGATERINAVLSYVMNNLSGHIGLQEAASKISMSPSAFSRFFHTTAGISFSQLVRRLRISRACHLLIASDLPVSKIQIECGYENNANFLRRFRQETGTTPLSYRRKYKTSPSD